MALTRLSTRKHKMGLEQRWSPTWEKKSCPSLVKLWQEMIHARGIEAAALIHPSSGQALLAFVLERKRAVGVLNMQSTKSMQRQT